MNVISQCQNLFDHSFFYSLNKAEELTPENKKILSQLILPIAVSTHHPIRKEEFMLGRLCACLAYQKFSGELLLELPIGKNREPLFPNSVVGSISHTKEWVGAVVADSSCLIGVGIDFEKMGRAKAELSRYITTDKDLKSVEGFNQDELLTLIFSAKESLYKALYPNVKKFFGFDSAAVTNIDFQNKSFSIQLLTQLSPQFGPETRSVFTGRFCIDQQTCLTAIEVKHSYN